MTYQLQELSVFVASINTERLFMFGEQDRIYVEVSMFYFKPYSYILLTALKKSTEKLLKKKTVSWLRLKKRNFKNANYDIL